MNVDFIISKFGDQAKMSRVTGFALTTISNWKTRNSIPNKNWPEIIEKAKKAGVDVAPADFTAAIFNKEPPNVN